MLDSPKSTRPQFVLKATLAFPSGWISSLLSLLWLALADDLVQQQEKLSVWKKTLIVQVDKLTGNVENIFFNLTSERSLLMWNIKLALSWYCLRNDCMRSYISCLTASTRSDSFSFSFQPQTALNEFTLKLHHICSVAR